MQTPPVLKATTATDAGTVHTVNGDTLGVREPTTAIERVEQGTIWVIADGVGNEIAGLQASRSAAQTIIESYWSSAVPDRAARLRSAVERANALLYDQNQFGSQPQGVPSGLVGATVIAAVIAEGRLYLAHVGRSRAYLYHANTLSRLTEDHSWVAEQVRAGLLAPEEAINHPRQNFITRCLGVKPTVKIDCVERNLAPDDVVLLCSDGLYRDLSDASISGILDRYGSSAAPILVDDAKRNGGFDNITAVTVSGEVVSIRETPTLERVARIARLGRELATSLDLDETLHSVLRQLLQISGGERAAVLIRESDGQLVPRIVHNMDPIGDLHSRTVAREAMRDRRPILIANLLDDERFSSVESIVAMSIRSILCVPMIVKEDAIGVLYVDSSTGSVLFSQSDLDLLISFAGHAAAAIQNARLHDEVLARTREVEHGRQRQDAIIRSLSSALVAIDDQGIVTDWNPMAEEILGRSAGTTMGQPLSASVPSGVASWLMALAMQVSASGMTMMTSHEWQGTIGDRKRVILAGRVARIRDNAEEVRGVVFIINDRTDMVLMEEARRNEAAAQERMRELFTRYLAPSVAEQLLHAPDAMQLGGARKEVTILFADVRGFTGFSEHRQPEEVVAMLNRYLTLATSEIFEQLGTLDKFLGDGVMAIFGAPLALPNHALAALRAAMAMQSHIDDLRRDTGVRVGFGIGLNSGPAIVGNIGSERFMNYTVIGDVVNVSARLQAEARAGEILISDATLKLVADKVRVEELGSIYVKGRAVPITTYKVLQIDN